MKGIHANSQPAIVADQIAWMRCHHCGNDHGLNAADDSHRCHTCGKYLYTFFRNPLSILAALTLTAFICWVVANSFIFLGLEAGGVTHQTHVLSGVNALIQRQQWLLAAIVFITIFLFPLFEMLALAYILCVCRYHKKTLQPLWEQPLPTRIAAYLLRLFLVSKAWSMLEIFLIGLLVTSTKLGHIATILPGVGLYALILLVLVRLLMDVFLKNDALWQALMPANRYFLSQRAITHAKTTLKQNTVNHDGEEPLAAQPDELVCHWQTSTLYDCHHCHSYVCPEFFRQQEQMHKHCHCPRCGGQIHAREPHSQQKALALLLAAIILYFPAMLLPIMTSTQLGASQSDTIMSGVIHLIHAGSWMIASVVFIASVFVPIVKILVLGYLIWSTYYGRSLDKKVHSRWYRVTEAIGRWSMIDVFVVTLLVALVQFGMLANIEPEVAIIAFAGVVVLTMLAAEVFDPRLLWDKADEQRQQQG